MTDYTIKYLRLVFFFQKRLLRSIFYSYLSVLKSKKKLTDLIAKVTITVTFENKYQSNHRGFKIPTKRWISLGDQRFCTYAKIVGKSRKNGFRRSRQAIRTWLRIRRYGVRNIIKQLVNSNRHVRARSFLLHERQNRHFDGKIPGSTAVEALNLYDLQASARGFQTA